MKAYLPWIVNCNVSLQSQMIQIYLRSRSKLIKKVYYVFMNLILSHRYIGKTEIRQSFNTRITGNITSIQIIELLIKFTIEQNQNSQNRHFLTCWT